MAASKTPLEEALRWPANCSAPLCVTILEEGCQSPMERDYYADLGVSRTASTEEINAAFRKLAAKYHPDRNPGDKAAEQKFTRMAEAYNVLKDPKSREAYDRGGSEQVAADTGFRGFDSSE